MKGLKRLRVIILLFLCTHIRLNWMEGYSASAEQTKMVISDTLHEGDLILEGGVTLTVKNCVYNVTDSTILRDNSRLLITNATIRTVLFEIFDLSQLKAVSSELLQLSDDARYADGRSRVHDHGNIPLQQIRPEDSRPTTKGDVDDVDAPIHKASTHGQIERMVNRWI